MDFRELKYIVTAAECGSITAAAKKLYIAQPSLSYVISKVEEETGLRNIHITRPYPNTYHTYTLHGTPILKITHWYEMQAPKQSLTPQTEEDIAQAVWMPRAEVSERLKSSYPSLCKLWTKIQ